MSEVIRVVTNKPCPLWTPNAKLDLHAVGDRCLKCEGEKFIVEYHDAQTAYDATQSELAALREELADCRFMLEANSKQVDRLIEEKADLRRDADEILKHRTEQRDDALQRLTSAKQRNADLCGLLVRTLPVVRMVGRQDHLCDYAMAGNIQAEIETTLNPKPAESGVSE